MSHELKVLTSQEFELLAGSTGRSSDGRDFVISVVLAIVLFSTAATLYLSVGAVTEWLLRMGW